MHGTARLTKYPSVIYSTARLTKDSSVYGTARLTKDSCIMHSYIDKGLI